MTHARAVDMVRSEAARRRREEAHGASALVSAQAGLSAWSGEVRAAVAELPEGERAAIVLTSFGGHTYREAARLLGQCPDCRVALEQPGTHQVGHRRHRGRPRRHLNSAEQLTGATVPVAAQGDEVTVGGQARVVVPDIQTANATVHLIDAVMLPPQG